MRRKQWSIFILVLFLIFFLASFPKAFANTSQSPTISDEIYADLAIRHLLDNVSVYYSDGKITNDVKLNETRHWLPASTVKIFTAMYAYKRIKEKTLHLDDLVVIDEKNNVPTELVTDDLPTLLQGETVTIDRLIRQMLIQSDNTAYNQLLDVLGRDNITAYVVSLGLTHSHIGSKLNLDTSQEQYEYDVPGYGINTTTAEDYGRAFTLIKTNKILGGKELEAILKNQRINNMIPYYLPKDVICAHKTGDLSPLYHDGGICEDKHKSYVVTIFTNAGDPNLVAHISQLIYTQDYNLVGKDIPKQVSQNQPQNYPLDPLVMSHPTAEVLGISNVTNIPTPNITAVDLGITSKDLSLVINDKNLPPVLIPADSPLHSVSDAWQVTKILFANGPKGRLSVDLEIAKLRVAEAKDLSKRGKLQDARTLMQNLQQGLNVVAQQQVLANDSLAQNTVQAISETRFAVLSNQLQQANGEEKGAIIKEIANQAKSTIQNVAPKIPDATNAINPDQKPLIGDVIKTSPTEITVKTAGGQEITIPTNNSSIVVKERQATSLIIPSGTPAPSSELSPTSILNPTEEPSLQSIPVGTTVALVGSSTNNTFSPSLVVTNLPKELAAPEPVMVAKVDNKHNTMVVIENGVYTQVNITNQTTIKGSGTNISLNQIKAGDVVVVHGDPLVPVEQPAPSPEVSPTIIPSTSPSSIPSTKPGQSVTPIGSTTGQPVISQSTSPSITTPIPSLSGTSAKTAPSSAPTKSSGSVTVIPTGNTTKIIPTTSTAGVKNTSNTVNPTAVIQKTTTNIVPPKSGVVTNTVNSAPAVVNPQKPATPTTTTPPPAVQPKIIQSTSIQVVEKKADTTTPPPASQPKAAEPKKEDAKPQQQQPQSQPPANNAPAPTSSSANSDSDKNKQGKN